LYPAAIFDWRVSKTENVMKGRQADMKKRLFKVEDQFCDECALALRRFIGHEEGIESVVVENRMIAVVFNPLIMPEERLDKLTKDSIEKLGHTLINANQKREK